MVLHFIFNPLMAVAAIWRFEVITRVAVCLNPADMYSAQYNSFQLTCQSVRLR